MIHSLQQLAYVSILDPWVVTEFGASGRIRPPSANRNPNANLVSWNKLCRCSKCKENLGMQFDAKREPRHTVWCNSLTLHKMGRGKMHLVHPRASMSSNVSKSNPSCNQNHTRDPHLNPVSYAVTIPNTNCTIFTICSRRMCQVRLCLVTSLTITRTNSNQFKPFLWHSWWP